jgi:hypothetical protein
MLNRLYFLKICVFRSKILRRFFNSNLTKNRGQPCREIWKFRLNFSTYPHIDRFFYNPFFAKKNKIAGNDSKFFYRVKLTENPHQNHKLSTDNISKTKKGESITESMK